jgi:hypothetical protein
MATTGMAERLKDCNFNLKKYLIEDMSRSFGMLVTLRDDSWELTEEQIFKILEDSVKQRLPIPDETQLSEVEYKKHLEKEYQSSRDFYKEKLTNAIKTLEKVKEVKKVLQEKSKLTTNEIVKNAISETLHQIKVIEEDQNFSIDIAKEVLSKSFETFERERKKDLNYKKEFYKECNEKEYKLSKERLEAYKEYVKEVKRLFHDN